MSASEVIEQIKHLPVEEQRTVYQFLREHIPATEMAEDSNPPVSEEFKRVADEIFATNAKLFQKLAH